MERAALRTALVDTRRNNCLSERNYSFLCRFFSSVCFQPNRKKSQSIISYCFRAKLFYLHFQVRNDFKIKLHVFKLRTLKLNSKLKVIAFCKKYSLHFTTLMLMLTIVLTETLVHHLPSIKNNWIRSFEHFVSSIKFMVPLNADT